MSDDVPTFSTGPIYGSTTRGSGKPLTFDDLLKMGKKLGPPPPPVDPNHCRCCKRTIGTLTRHGVRAGSSPMSNPIAYLCWDCLDALKDCAKETNAT